MTISGPRETKIESKKNGEAVANSAAHNIHRVNAALMELEWNTGMAREAGNEAGKLQAETMCEQIEEKHKQPGTYLVNITDFSFVEAIILSGTFLVRCNQNQ